MIKGIKLIRHNASGVNEPDDLSYPFLLHIVLRAPEFMTMAFIGLCGGGGFCLGMVGAVWLDFL